MNKNRPVNLDLSTIKFPVTAIVSILHRVSGVVMLGGVIVLLYMLDMSLSSEKSYDELASLMALPWAKLILWAVLSALAYHFVAGVRHLIMDLGVGESLEGGKLGAKISIFLSVVLIISAGFWVW
ncbi:succinate dehydrogenase, cytochrome b556 subunit [Teredinibacter purpureus]|uniref:succinate dehydrogenase, cytochrome b556 subunit n=1 Tax=Teredinibacter purpureus TaxID=2731756 RepID=UPI0005F85C43|nr:succinate dehydrogenase, cytochrome b556 subunit [Teredinibacter purpureus]